LLGKGLAAILPRLSSLKTEELPWRSLRSIREPSYAIDTQSLEVIGEAVDSPYPAPHNITLTPNGRLLFLTHSGGTSDKVTIYHNNSVTRLPTLVGEVTVGLNPFGLDYVP
jgi:hypothetical protein